MNWLDTIKWDAQGLVPVIAQELGSKDVLMFAWMNREALQKTAELGRAVYFSRSRGKLWVKGEESGNVQWVKELYSDCDQDVLLIKVEQVGAANASCHNGYKSCFYRKLENLDAAAEGTSFKLVYTAERLFDPATVYNKK
jgi:phosphoribosyl-AMP cyclohydrolase